MSPEPPSRQRPSAPTPPRSGIGLIRELHGAAAESGRLRQRDLLATGFDASRSDVVRLAVEACGARLVGFEAAGAAGPPPVVDATVSGVLVGPSPNPATLAVAAQNGWEPFDEETFTAICRAVLTHRTKPTHAIDAQLARARDEARTLARNGVRPPAPPTEEEVLRNVEARRLHMRGGDAKPASSTAARAARGGGAPAAPSTKAPILRAPAAPPSPGRAEAPPPAPPPAVAPATTVNAVAEERSAFRGAMMSEWRALRSELAALRDRVATHSVEARTDPLTGLANRRLFEEDLPALHEHATATGHGYAVVFIDLDHFGELNKAHGHEHGDGVLRAAAQAFATALGDEGTLYRIGGEEFVVIAPGASAEQGAQLGERLRASLVARAMRRGHDADAGLVTASIGIAAMGPTHGDHAAVVRDANQAMLGAKSAGRDRVAVSEAVADAA